MKTVNKDAKNRLAKYEMRAQYLERLIRENSPVDVIERQRKKVARLRPPTPYRSWKELKAELEN